MPVVVPSAPEMQETTRMLEDSESVSSQGHRLSQGVQVRVPGPGGVLVVLMLCAGPRVRPRCSPSLSTRALSISTEPGTVLSFHLLVLILTLV